MCTYFSTFNSLDTLKDLLLNQLIEKEKYFIVDWFPCSLFPATNLRVSVKRNLKIIVSAMHKTSYCVKTISIEVSPQDNHNTLVIIILY